MVDSIKSRVNDQITSNDNVIITGDTIINGRCNIYDSLRVLETSEFGKTIIITTSSKGGEIYELNLPLIIKNHI